MSGLEAEPGPGRAEAQPGRPAGFAGRAQPAPSPITNRELRRKQVEAVRRPRFSSSSWKPRSLSHTQRQRERKALGLHSTSSIPPSSLHRDRPTQQRREEAPLGNGGGASAAADSIFKPAQERRTVLSRERLSGSGRKRGNRLGCPQVRRTPCFPLACHRSKAKIRLLIH